MTMALPRGLAAPPPPRPFGAAAFLPWVALLLAALLPLLPGFPPFWVTLLCQIGIAALVALGADA